MIKGIGVDIVSVDRIKAIYEKFGEKFLKKIFTDNEIKYSFSHKNPFPHFAARFAAKEAVIKALNKPEGLKLKDIEIINSSNGSPQIAISGSWFMDKEKTVINCSLSHEKNYAVAFVIIS
ncbi:holo-ACP synthase [Thermodesulfovibrio hydrogeniphilus]